MLPWYSALRAAAVLLCCAAAGAASSALASLPLWGAAAVRLLLLFFSSLLAGTSFFRPGIYWRLLLCYLLLYLLRCWVPVFVSVGIQNLPSVPRYKFFIHSTLSVLYAYTVLIQCLYSTAVSTV